MRLLDQLWNDILACLRFFSRLPLPARAAPDDALPGSVVPLAGFIIGLVPALTLSAALALGFPPVLGGALSVAASLVVTGAMHEDGLADCADGFGGGWDRARKLAIMRDSHIGTYGVCALIVSLSIRALAVGSLAARLPLAASATLVMIAGLSRTACLLPLLILSPARPDGLGASASRPTRESFTLATAICVLGALVLLPLGLGLIKIVGTLVVGFGAAYLVCRLADRQIGGQTGDVAGAAQQAAEIAALLVLAAG